MTAAIGKYAANKMLKKHMKGYESKKVAGGDDPYFAYIEDPKRPGKTKKVKKQIPDYVSEHDAMVLAKVRRRSYRMDMALFDLFGIRFGWEAVIGIVPAIGDAIGVLIALKIFNTCCGVEGGLPQSVKLQMMFNIILDFVVGLVPFIGDLADAAFKANTRNCRLLEKHLEKNRKDKPEIPRDDARAYGGDSERRRKNRAGGIYLRNDPPPATVFDLSDEEDERRQLVREHDTAYQPVQQPQPTREAEDRRGGWFSGGRKGSRRDPQPTTRQASYRQQESGRTTR